MNNKKMTIAQYEPLAAPFNPTEFDAAAWVGIAKAAGMKYITNHKQTSRWFRHVGNSAVEMEHCRRQFLYRKDPPQKCSPMSAANRECKLLFYHSELDQHNPITFPVDAPAATPDRPRRAATSIVTWTSSWTASFRELLTNYGDVAGIWFDGAGGISPRRIGVWRKPTA